MDFTETLSFDHETGQFAFGSLPQKSTGSFRIPLRTPGTITINAGSGLEFTPITSDLLPVEALNLNSSGAFEVLSLNATQIKLNVTTLPSTGGVLGFMLFTQFTTGSATVKGIETPPFFITRDQPFTAPEFRLNYSPSTGDFHIGEGHEPELPLLLPVEKGVVVLRLSQGGSNDTAVETINVILHQDAIAAGVKFAHTAAHSTLPPNSSAVPSINRVSNTEVAITRTFTPGTGFGVSFGVDVPNGNGETCTVFSPDPVIIDKQIGGSGG